MSQSRALHLEIWVAMRDHERLERTGGRSMPAGWGEERDAHRHAAQRDARKESAARSRRYRARLRAERQQEVA